MQREFVRFAVVGVASNALLYVSYLLITALGVGHKFAMTLLYIAGVLLTFAVNRRWSFEHRGLVRKSLPRYIVAYLLGYFVNFMLLWTAVDQLRLPHQLVQGISIIVVAVLMFLMHRFWVFKSEAHPA